MKISPCFYSLIYNFTLCLNSMLKSIREIAEKVFENNKEAQTVKLQYMKFLQCYTSQIRKFGITEEYHNFLWDIILADDTYSLRDLEFITELRKKMTAIIALTFS